MLTPADEEYDVDPDPRLEKFFHIIMLVLGDPDSSRWIESNAQKFYTEFRTWLNFETRVEGPVMDRYPDPPTAMLQYFVWYDRERAHVDGRQD